MRLHYVSFFYFNIVLLFLFFLKIDLIFLLFVFTRKIYSMYKESYLEYFTQDIDGLQEDIQTIDLIENKLYLDFGLDVELEEQYQLETYMEYALYDFNMDFELFTGQGTFLWDEFNLENLNYEKNYKTNFKKVFLNNLNFNLFFWNNFKQKKIDTSVRDDDYTYIYNYKNIIKREIENITFGEENEKYYYPYLKKFFVKENFYDIFIEDFYIRLCNYNGFIDVLKDKVKEKKFKKIERKKSLNNDINAGLQLLNYNEYILEIKNEIRFNNPLDKKNEE